jgi:hypothetical protein
MTAKVLHLARKMPAARRRQIAPNGVIGMGIFVFAEVMFFAGLISAHTIVKSGALTGWPPPGQPRLPFEETAVNTLALLASGVALALSHRALTIDPARAARWLLAAIGLGAFFVVFQGFEWVALLHEGLTMTVVTVGPPGSPSGLPTATAGSPMARSFAVPNGIGARSPRWTRRTAMSVTGSLPTTSAPKRAPSENTTKISLAPSTTW